jgi:hypothetical protein
MPDSLKNKLKEIGLNLGGRGRPFGIDSEEKWSMNYKALADYCSEEGDCDVPEKYDQDRELGKILLVPLYYILGPVSHPPITTLSFFLR